MTFEHFLAILIKRWRLIVICFLLIGAGAAIGTKRITPLYQSTALVQVAVASGSNPSDYTNLLASQQLAQTEAILATSTPVLREVASHYKGVTIEQLSKESTAAAKLNTQLFEIDVLDPSPTRAAVLANDIAATLIKQQFQMTQQNNLLVVQPAQPSLGPAQPNNLLNTGAGLVTGLLVGILLALLFEQLDMRVRTSEALAQLLNWPIQATVWLLRSSKDEEDVLHVTGSGANVEAYRILRTNIGFSAVDKPLHSLAVTSALPGEGKTVIAANLAIFMAKAGKSTLLVDANLRHPRQQELFDLPADAMGFSNAILACGTPTTGSELTYRRHFSPTTPAVPSSAPGVSRISLDPFVYATDIPNLYIMPSGPLPPNPPDLLDSKAMQRLFTAIANCEFEVVIFDTSPLLGLSDARILTSKVDGTLVVVDITRADRRSLKQMKALLVQAGAHVLGCIVNKQSLNRMETTYYPGGQNNEEDLGIPPKNTPVTGANDLDSNENTIKIADLMAREVKDKAFPVANEWEIRGKEHG